MRFREADRMLKDDGWYVSDISGSHYQYKHPTKPGKVSVPNILVTSRKVLLNPYASRRGCNKPLPLANNIDYTERSNDL